MLIWNLVIFHTLDLNSCGSWKVFFPVCFVIKVTTLPCETRPQGYKKYSCSTQLSMKFFLLMNVKMPTIVTVVGILTFMSGKNNILGLSEHGKAEFLDFLYLRAFKISCSAMLSIRKVL